MELVKEAIANGDTRFFITEDGRIGLNKNGAS